MTDYFKCDMCGKQVEKLYRLIKYTVVEAVCYKCGVKAGVVNG